MEGGGHAVVLKPRSSSGGALKDPNREGKKRGCQRLFAFMGPNIPHGLTEISIFKSLKVFLLVQS